MTPPNVAMPTSLSLRAARARRQLEELLTERQWPGDVDGVVLAMHEALVNANRHAGGAVAVEVFLDGSTLVIDVCDRGPGFELPSSPPVPDPLAERGRGLWLMCRVTERCEVHRDAGSTCVRLCFEAR